ncbi:MAG: hypothetical protein CMC09_00030 [Flavobacteriaceae bacterium]|nr:hypothetical protein [Flavobacteriaceae bacterium]
MWFKGVRISALIGRVFTVTLLTKFNYLETSAALAILFTTSSLFNAALPPLHKEIYLKAVKNKVYNLREILMNYFFPLSLILIFSSFIVCILIRDFLDQFDPSLFLFTLIFFYLVTEKIFDEFNRYSLTFQKYFPWNIICISRTILNNIIFFILIISGKYSEEIIFKFILIMFSISTLTPFLLILKPLKIKRTLTYFYKMTKYSSFKFLTNKKAFKAWLISLSMLLPTYSERIASLTAGSSEKGKMYIAVSIFQLITFFVDLQINSNKKSEIIKNKSLKELLRNSKIFIFSSLIITLVCLGYIFFNISDGLYSNFNSVFILIILGLSIVLNSLSLIQEERIFWAKKYKSIFIEMLIISSLLTFSFIFLRFNTLILSLGIIITNIARFTISTKIANEY